jgi:hypothetical protein
MAEGCMKNHQEWMLPCYLTAEIARQRETSLQGRVGRDNKKTEIKAFGEQIGCW